MMVLTVIFRDVRVVDFDHRSRNRLVQACLTLVVQLGASEGLMLEEAVIESSGTTDCRAIPGIALQAAAMAPAGVRRR
jgi:hypothetical protein